MATRKRKTEEEIQESPLMNDVVDITQYIPVEGNKDLVRDPNTGAILNTNKKAYFRAVQEKQRRNQEQSEYDSLKTEVAELKSMLAHNY
jgi:hypothetical protein